MWLNWLLFMATTLKITHVSIGVEKTVCQTGKGSDPSEFITSKLDLDIFYIRECQG
jgi:hypothetical protein